MSSTVILFLVALGFALLAHTAIAQLGNQTYTTSEILDIYRPKPNTRGNSTRIVGGKEISILNVPWQVALFESNSFICGGSIISQDWVLTAAHCVGSGGSFAVRAGSPNFQVGGQTRRVVGWVVHGLYDANTMNHDIAMMRVHLPFTWARKVLSVYLPTPRTALPKSFFVSGWGTVIEGGNTPLYLRGVTIQRVYLPVCQKDYRASNIPITYNMICAAETNRDSCQGDSGGPLVRGRIQYGVVSFGIGCARPQYPGVYTKVSKHYKWIKEVVQVRGGQMPIWV